MSSSINTTKLLHQLKKIGLKDTDAQIYLASINIGACSIKQLTQHTGINRITTHDSVGRLIDKGLLLETYSGKRRLIFPQQIGHLQHLVDVKKSQLDQLQHDISSTIHLLQSLHLQSDHLPQIRISKGRQGINDMLSEIHHAKTTQLKVISDSRHFDELISIDFLDKLSKTNTQIQMLLPAGFDHFIFSAHAKGLPIQTKHLTAQTGRTGGMTLRDSTVALHAYEGVYITTTLIQNDAIATMMQCFFENLYCKS